MSGLSDTDPRRLGPYRLLGVLGHGGTGTVYLGRGAPRRGARRQLAAVRALRPELLRDRQTRARLRQQTQAVGAAAAGPWIAAALGCELDSERPWLATAFVPGAPLASLVERCGPLPERAVRALGGALARALAALHAVGVAHRDLRPENVLLTAGAPRVVDYALGPGHGDPGSGGAQAVAPAKDVADDVFELGATLVLAAAGHQPFAGSLLPAVREGPDLTGVPDALCPPLLGCLHKTPESRPSADVLARVLDPSDTAEAATADGLPEPYRDEIGAVERAARALTGRRLFGG